MKSTFFSRLNILWMLLLTFSAHATTYTAKSSGFWTDKIWQVNGNTTPSSFVALHQVTFQLNDQIMIDPGTNGNIYISGTVTITPTITITVKSGTFFFQKPGVLMLHSLSSKVIVNAGAFSDSDDSGNNILLTFGTQNDYNGKDLRNGVGPLVFQESGNDTPLPIHLIYFEAKSNNQIAELTWATSLQTNFSHFEIERSTDLVHFTKIVEVAAIHEGEMNKYYSFNDTEPLQGVSYYRLKSVDLDGTSEYFKCKAVNMTLTKVQFAYPNPVIDKTLHIQAEIESYLQIFDYQGHLKSVIHLQVGHNQVNWNEYEAGMYILSLNGRKERIYVQ